MSKGHASAQRINRASLTPDPLLLHRVDARQLPDGRTVQVAGHVEQRPATTASAAPLRSIKPPRAGCTHDCSQGRACTCAKPHTKATRPADEPTPLERVPDNDRGLFWWAMAVAVFCLLAAAKALIGPPHNH